MRTSWIDSEVSANLNKIASEIQSSLDAGQDFANALKNILPEASSADSTQLKIEQSAELSREDTSSELSSEAVLAGFSVGLEKSTVAPGVNKSEQVVMKVITISDSKINAVGEEDKKRLDDSIGDDILNQLIGDLQQKETVTVNQSAIVAAQNLIR